MFRTVVSLCLIAAVFGQVPYSGKCPDVEVKKDFELSKYAGRWYEMKRYFAVFQMFSDCVTAEYTPLGDGIVKVNNTGFDHLNKRYITAIGDATQQDPTTASKLGVLFPGAPARGNYWVLDTDYDTYTVVWSCSESNMLGYTYNTQNTWILTRNQDGISADIEQRINTLLQKYNIPLFERRTNQIDCPGRSTGM